METNNIEYNPSENDLLNIKTWLSEEYERYNNGFYCNWNLIESSFRNNQLICLMNNSIIIGFVTYNVFKFHTEVNIMSIKHDYRKRGFGAVLYKKIENYFKSQGFLAIKLFCEPRESELFWQKMGFIKFPNRGYSESDLTYYKPLIEFCSPTNNPDYLNRLELWDVESVSIKNKAPRWIWNIEIIDGHLTKPIIQPCNEKWHLRWVKNGQVVLENSVKYFSYSIPIDFPPFMYIHKLNEE